MNLVFIRLEPRTKFIHLGVALALTLGMTLTLLGAPAQSVYAAPGREDPGYPVYLPMVTKPAATLAEQVTRTSLNLPHPLEGPVFSWCTWGWCSISPRLYHAPLADGGALLGWTDNNGTGHVSQVSASGCLGQTFDFPGRSLHGLVAHSDGKFAVLQFDPATSIMWLSKYNANGSLVWSTNIKGSLTRFDWDIGDSRLAYGGGLYGAYFAVYGESGWVQGHNGDQLTYVNDNGAIQGGGWEWGCSHSMAEIIDYHPSLGKFLPACSSDAYPKPGVVTLNKNVIVPGDGDKAGKASTQLGQVAQAGSTWKLVFSALRTDNAAGKGIGLATINADLTGSVVWLTDTEGEYERDPAIARLGSSLSSDRYLVGWKTSDDNVYHLGIVNGAGEFLMPPENVSAAGIGWGNRDDSFRTRPDGKVSWVQGSSGSAVIRYYVFDGH